MQGGQDEGVVCLDRHEYCWSHDVERQQRFDVTPRCLKDLGVGQSEHNNFLLEFLLFLLSKKY